MRQGKIFKAAGGFFSLRDEEGAEFTCRARGALKRNQYTLMVGDEVIFQTVTEPNRDSVGEGVIEKLLPRRNILRRPAVVNVDQLAVVFSLKNPPCDWQLASRLTVLAEQEGISAFFCFNKADLVNEDEFKAIDALLTFYPYFHIFTSALTGEGITMLKNNLAGRCSVFAGPSGAGKSSLLNAVQPGLTLQTGTISEKIGRGKHTTRSAELLLLDNGGMVVDTPGFTRLDFVDLKAGELAHYFPEFADLRSGCNFRDCQHLDEPGCAVRESIGKSINPLRYEYYRFFMEELNRQEAY
ncbi:MAG: ribosome small subunit-dependent GTPase A [Bacillota bacterium]|nr:ribosome small subunit-dependent GTPase A [Bacillota bacterium]